MAGTFRKRPFKAVIWQAQNQFVEAWCHAKQESSQHFMIDCFLYSVERQTLYSLVEQFVPNFNRLGKFKKYETLIMGVNIDNPDYDYTNTNIMFAVQNFITKTKRFPEK